jgi:hypothetical protein
MKKEKRLVVACGIFRSELSEVFREEDRFDLDVVWLKAGYHARTDLLAPRLREILAGLDESERRGLRVMYGRACLLAVNDDDLMKDAPTPPTDNCLTALVGLSRLRELEAGRTMVVTPSWIRDVYMAGDPELMIWDECEFRMNFGRYDRVTVLDSGLDSLSDEEILEAFDRIGVPIEIFPISLDRFKRLTRDFLS